MLLSNMIEQYINPFFEWLVCWWQTLSPTARGIIGPVFLWGGGFVVVVWQIRKQLENAIRKNQHNEKLKLKLELYKEFVELISSAETAAGDLGHYISSIVTDINLFNEQTRNGKAWSVPRGRATITSEKSFQLITETINILFQLEKWNILEPRLEVFKTAFNVAVFDFNKIRMDYFNLAMKILPTEVRDTEISGTLFPWTPPSAENFDMLSKLTDQMQFEIGKLSCWVSDLQTELQNNMLGEMFNNNVPIRRPLDSRLFAITLDESEKILAYFEMKTDWGKHKQEIHERTQRTLSEMNNGADED